MTDQACNEPAAMPRPDGTGFDERLHVQLGSLARAVNATSGRLVLYLLGGSITLVIIATAVMQVVLNAWMQPFYDAIEKKELAAFVHQLVVFFGIAGVLLLLNVAQMGFNQAIRLKLREFATTDLIANWMTRRRAARIGRAGQIGVNPDQRIHQDANHLTDLTTALGIGLLQASLLLVSFVGVLWEVSRGIVLHFMGHAFQIPGYMVWAALIYAATGSWFSWRVGRRLVRLQQDHYAREADLRIALVRGVQQADGIALNNGEADERRRLDGALENVLAVLWRIVVATVRLTFVTAGYGWAALIFPVIVAAPGYFSGDLSFGALMMTVGAFNQVQEQLRWFVDNTGVIADWRATLLRVMNFRQALVDLDRLEAGRERIERRPHPEGRLVFDDVSLAGLRGRTKLSEPHIEVAPGERVLIAGESGLGKSTLFLAIAGLWDRGSGCISLPPEEDTMFLPQTPFIPPGPLRAVLTYSDDPHAYGDDELTAALRRIGLGHLCRLLDYTEQWDAELTVEEQQSLAVARMLLKKPKWVISDEAIDLMEVANREIVLSVFAEELAGTAVVSIVGSPVHDGFYSRVVPVIAGPVDANADVRTPQPAGSKEPAV